MKIKLGSPSVESVNRTFECKQGHKVISNSPPTISWYAEATDGPPVCPFCIIEFVRQMFPMQETVAATRVIATTSTPAPAFNPCKTENCILAFHGGNQHMNAQREFFTHIPQETHNDSQRAGDSGKAPSTLEPSKP